jgi:hypothetical protein
VTRQAADAAVSRAIDELLDRLGLSDEEGLRMAIRLARGWEAAKIRFVSAVTPGSPRRSSWRSGPASSR